MAVALHGPDASAQQLKVGELDARVMRHAFAAWASDHAAASMVRAWGTFNRFFAYLIDARSDSASWRTTSSSS